MTDWYRRSVLATTAALSTAGGLASIGSTADEGDDEKSSRSPVAVGDPDGWSSARGNAANGRYLPLEDEFPEPDAVAWRYDLTGTAPDVDGRVAVVDGRVYVQRGPNSARSTRPTARPDSRPERGSPAGSSASSGCAGAATRTTQRSDRNGVSKRSHAVSNRLLLRETPPDRG